MELNHCVNQFHKNLVVHVDIFTPFANILLSQKEDLLKAISVETFQSYAQVALLKQANLVKIVTIQPPRSLIFQRWLNRCVQQKSPLVRTLLTQIYSDVFGEELYQKLYQVWDEFSADLPNVMRWQADEHELEGYKLSKMRLNDVSNRSTLG